MTIGAGGGGEGVARRVGAGVLLGSGVIAGVSGAAAVALAAGAAAATAVCRQQGHPSLGRADVRLRHSRRMLVMKFTEASGL